MRALIALASLTTALTLVFACSSSSDGDADADVDGDADLDGDSDVDGDTDADTDGDTDGDADGDSDGDADVQVDADFDLPAFCPDGGCACSDGLDNDDDGLIDGYDPECTSPYDNDEGSFGTGIPGDNRDPNWQDCWFDGNSGGGDDGCRYHTECLTDPEHTSHDCTLSAECIESCLPMVPNGCDCFACCTVYDDAGVAHNVVLSDECTRLTLNDPERCTPCTPTTDCDNPCGECELCLGRTVDDLPASCFESPDGGPDAGPDSGPDAGPDSGPDADVDGPVDPPFTCDDGLQRCAPGDPPCPANYWCHNGCCLLAPS